jgi:anti-anti-sigma factor
MKVTCREDTLSVSEIEQLTAGETNAFRSAVGAALGPELRHVEIDLSHTERLDCAGLGALLALRETLLHRQPQTTFALLHPSLPVQRLLQLTRTDELFALPHPEPA